MGAFATEVDLKNLLKSVQRGIEIRQLITSGSAVSQKRRTG
jgi:hypothetical protein